MEKVFIIIGAFANYRGFIWQSHNQILQIWYETGIVGLFLFLMILILAGINIRKIDSNLIYLNIIVFGLFGMFVMMITEILSIYIYIYMFLIILYNIDKIKKRGKEYDK